MSETQTTDNENLFDEFFYNQMELIKDEIIKPYDYCKDNNIVYGDLCIDESLENAKKNLFKNPEDLPQEFKDICDKYFKIHILRNIHSNSYDCITNLYKLYYLYEQYNEFKNNTLQIGTKEIQSGFFEDEDIENTNIFENGKVEAITTDLHASMNATISFLLESGVAKFKDGEKPFIFFDMRSKKSYNSVDEFLEQNPEVNIAEFEFLKLIPNLELNKDYNGVAINCGDFVDRGKYTDEVVSIFSYLEEQEKNELPENKKIIRLCGNHEVAKIVGYSDLFTTFNNNEELFLRDILDDKVKICYADNGFLYSHTLLDPIDLSKAIKYIEDFKKKYPNDFKSFFGEDFNEEEFNVLKEEINRVALDSFFRKRKLNYYNLPIESKELFNNIKLKDKNNQEFNAIDLINEINELDSSKNFDKLYEKYENFKNLLELNKFGYKNLTFQNIQLNGNSINPTDLFPKYLNPILKIHAVQQLILNKEYELPEEEKQYFDIQNYNLNKKLIEEILNEKFPNYTESEFYNDYKENGEQDKSMGINKELKKFFYQGNEEGIFANRDLKTPTYKAGYGHSIINGESKIKKPVYKNGENAIGLCFDNGQTEGDFIRYPESKTHAICFKPKGNNGKPQTIFTEIDASLKHQCDKENSLLKDNNHISAVFEKEMKSNTKIIVNKDKANKEQKRRFYKKLKNDLNKMANNEESYNKFVLELFNKSIEENDIILINKLVSDFVEKINNNIIKNQETIKTFIMISEHICREKNSNKQPKLKTEFINNINAEKIQKIFILACKNGNSNLVDSLLSNSNLVISKNDRENLLNDAIAKNDIETTKVLIKNGFKCKSEQLEENIKKIKKKQFNNIKYILTDLAKKHNIGLEKLNKIKLKTKKHISKNKENYTYLDDKDFNELNNLLDTISNKESNRGCNI